MAVLNEQFYCLQEYQEVHRYLESKTWRTLIALFPNNPKIVKERMYLQEKQVNKNQHKSSKCRQSFT